MKEPVRVSFENGNYADYMLEDVSNKTINELANEIYLSGDLLPKDVVTITVLGEKGRCLLE